MNVSTKELEAYFYQGEEGLQKVLPALQGEMDAVEDGEKTMRSYITDNLEEADKLMNEQMGLYGVLVRALEMADAALDYHENKYLEEIRQTNEKDATVTKKPTDSVLKAQAAAKVSPYRRMRGFIRGYVSSLEKSISGLRSSIDKGNAQLYTAKRQTFQQTQQS